MAATSAATPLGAVVVTGSTVYAAPQLFATYRDQLGVAITRDSAGAISNALADLYLNDGYVQPELTIDDTRVVDGLLRIGVIEARVTHVIFEGESGDNEQALQRIAAQLTRATPLRRDDIPDALRDMRALPGLDVQASARRDADTQNGYELVVRTGYSPVEGSVRVSNRGTDEIGPMFVMGQLFANGLIGARTRAGLIFASATDADEYLGGGLYLESPLGRSGTRATALLFGSRASPHERPADLDYRYSRQRATLRLLRPVHAASTSSLTVSVGLDADDLGIRQGGTSIRDDQLRVVEVALRGAMLASGSMQYAANLQLRQGLDALGASLDSGLVTDPRRLDFLVAQLQVTALRRFAQRWSARLDTFAQYSGQVLPDNERFKIGGDRLGRGFEVAQIAGDRGLGGKFELRRDLFDAGSWLGNISSYGFYDIGAAWKRHEPGHEYAATSGAGLAMAGKHLTGYVELATPVSGIDIDERDGPSVFAELTWRF